MSKALENMSFEQLLEASKKMESEKAALESKNSELESLKTELESKLSDLQFRVDQLNRLLFGAKRERFIKNEDENQMKLPFDVT